MAFYTKAQILLLVDLINTSNPGLNYDPLALTTTRLGIPYPYSGDRINPFWDTTIEVFPRDASKFIGRAVVHYRRIRLERLFKHQPVRLDRWCDGTLTPEVLVDLINQQFGTTLVLADIEPTTWVSSPEVQYATITDASLCYRGQLPFIWEEGKRAFDQIFPVVDFKARIWDARHGGVDDPRPLLTNLGFGNDYSDFLETVNRIPNGHVINNNSAFMGLLVNRLNATHGTALSVRTHHTQENGLGGLTVTKVKLPNSLLPETNKDVFSHALSITSLPTSWFGGRLLFHYNEIQAGIKSPTLTFGDSLNVDVFDSQFNSANYRYWSLEVLEGSTDEDLSSFRGRFQMDVNPYPLLLPVPQSVSSGKSITMVYHIRRDSPTGPILTTTDPFVMSIPAVVVSDYLTPQYGESVTFTIDDYSGNDTTTYLYVVEPVEGRFSETIQGNVTTLEGKGVLELAISARIAVEEGVTWRLHLYSTTDTDLQGNPRLLAISALHAMDDLTNELTFTQSGEVYVPPNAVSLLIDMSAGAGGGGGGGNTQFASYVLQPGRGGDGQRLLSEPIPVAPGQRIVFTIGQGGEGGGDRTAALGNNGLSGRITTLTLPDGTVLSAREGGGGSGGGRVSTPTNPRHGFTFAPPGSAGGGPGVNSTVGHSRRPGGKGQGGWVRLKWRGW